MKTLYVIAALFVLTFFGTRLQGANTTASLNPPTVPDATAYRILERGADYRIWQKTVLERGPNGKTTPVIHKYTELAAGLYHKGPKGEWVESKAIIKPLSQGGAAATEGGHKAYFPEDIYDGYIKVVMEDNQMLKSRPVMLSYDDGNNIVVLAQLTNSPGQLLGDNQVIYANAFVGIWADVVYTYRLGGFEQDIILRERPPSPESLGLNPATARLQILTEFFDPPTPLVKPLTLPNQSGLALADQFLDFGKVSIVPGQAFLINSGTNAGTGKVSVGKQWLNIGGRQILVEEVPIAAVADQIATLTASLKTGRTGIQTMASAKRQLPPARLAKSGGSGRLMKMAVAVAPSLGLVMDYNIVLGNKVDFTFQGDTTYYINGQNWFGGTTTIEGGAVIKYESTNDCELMVRGPLVCKTVPYHPAIITLSDDDTAGEVLPGSTGNPVKQTVWMPHRSGALFSWYGGLKLHDLMIRYLHGGISILTLTTNLENEVKNCQFESVFTPIYTFPTNNLNLQNVLINDANVCFMIRNGGMFNVENTTIHNVNLLFWQPGETPTMAFTNCLFIGVTNCLDPDPANYWRVNYPTPFAGYNCVTNLSDAGVFQAVGAGRHYLATNSPYRNAGTTGINPLLLSELRQKTTIPPVLYSNTTFTTATVFSPQVQTDTNSNPDLGYHYDPVDYLVSSCTVSNATLTVTNGAIVASHGQRGLQLLNGSQLVSIGTPLVPNMFVRGASVQERPSPATNGITADVTGTVNALFRFTRFTCPADSGYDLHHVGSSSFASLDVQNCEFWGGANDLSGSTNTATATIKNNLFWRSSLFASNTSAQASLFLTNNTFWGTTVTLKQPSSGLWSAFNNNFDSCTVSGTLTNGYNAYLKTSGRLSPTNVHDYISTSTLAYQSGPLGDYYQSTASLLVNAGNASASQLGLYQFTTQTNQAKDGSTMVDIGYHYVALDTNGYPLASGGDGIPDYIEDPAGITNCSSAPWIITLPISQSAIVGDDIVFTVAAAGVPTPSYQWYFNGIAIGGATNTTLTLNNVQTSDIGSYAVVVSNPFGWQSSQATLSVSAAWNYVVVSGALTNFVFQGDTTYYVNSPVQLYGITTIEGGTVIKYGNNAAAQLVLNGPVKCLTAAYRPAILTSRDENMVGVSIHQSTGIPTNNCATYIVNTAGQTNDLKYLHIKYAGTGILASSMVDVWNSQFVQCGTAVSSTNGGTLALHNVLIAQSTNCVLTSGNVSAEFLTADQCVAFCPIAYGGASLTNSLLTAVANTGGVSLVASESLTSNSGIYQVVGGGSYYLATNSPYHNAGTTNITAGMLRDLKTKTTYPPIIYGTTNIYWGTSLNLYPQAQRDTNALDLGYHYEALDYILGSMYVTNASITINPGTAVGIYSIGGWNYGLALAENSSFTSIGTADKKNHLTQYLAVQEMVASGWVKTWYGSVVNFSQGAYDIKSEFTDWSILASDGYPIRLAGNGVYNFKNCEFWGGQIESYYPTLNFTNCLFERVNTYLEYDNYEISPSFCNNLVRGGNFYYYPWTVTNAVVNDNLFDNVNIDSWFGGDDGTLYDGGHNAYVTNCTRLIAAKPGDLILSASPAYQVGPLGNYYLPADSPLINAGSTTADQVGLYHFTSQVDQTKEAFSTVDIGYHYVAVDINGVSKESNGNWIPDYLEDANGNGLVDNGESPWILLPTITMQPTNQTVFVGSNATFSVTASGTAPLSYQWYFNGGALIGQTNSALTLTNVQTVNAGVYYATVSNNVGKTDSAFVILKMPLAVVAWGNYGDGQTNVPADLTNAVAISAGYNYCMALRCDGTVVAWGYNGSGQTDVPAGLTNVVAIACERERSMALKSDGTITIWGLYYPTGESLWLTDVTAISGGGDHGLALKSNGTVAAWGNDGSGQTDVPEGLTNVVAIAGGGYHSLALKNDGAVVAWGYSGDGVIDVPLGLTNVVAIACGRYHSLALKSDGTVVAWGLDNDGQTDVPAGLTNVVAIAGGNYHSLAFKSDGTVVAWGLESQGQTDVPAGLTNVVAIAGGGYHSLALGNNAVSITTQPQSQTIIQGEVATFGVIVNGTTPFSYQWLKDGVNIVGATSNTYTIAETTTNDAAGYSVRVINVVGSVTSSTATLTVSVPISIVMQPQSLSVNPNSTAMFTVTATGSIPLNYQWQKDGVNIDGATSSTYIITVVATNDAGNYTVVVDNIVGSVTSSVATLTVNKAPTVTLQPRSQTVIQEDVAVFAVAVTGTTPFNYQWYYNGVPLIDQTNASLSLTNVQSANAGMYCVVVTNVAGNVNSSNAMLAIVTAQPVNIITNVGGSAAFSVAITGAGPQFYQWQRNGINIANGNRISGADTNILTLTYLEAQDAGIYSVVISNVAGNFISTYAMLKVLAPSKVVAWGDNTDEQANAPWDLTNFVTVAGGSYHSLAVKSDGTVAAWGDNSFEQTTLPDGLTNVVAVAAGLYHSYALRSGGRIVAWGDDSYGQTNIPIGVLNVVAIASGLNFGLALKSDGTVAAWGDNSYEQTTLPDSLTNVVAVAAGFYHSLAIKMDGSVVAWGDDGYGQTDVPVGLTNVIAIAGGGYHSLALKSDGTVVAWGYDGDGAIDVPAGLTNVMAIACGKLHCLALKSNGSVIAWGWDYFGQAEVPVGLTNVATIAGGERHNLALGNMSLSIIRQPQSLAVNPGNSATFIVSASGTAPLGYQWQKSGVDISGATSSSYTIAGVTTDDAAGYAVVVHDATGAVISSNAVLMVVDEPVWQDTDYDGRSDAQEVLDGTASFNPDSVLQVRLGHWNFDNTNTWAGDAGQLPLLTSNLVGNFSWNNNGIWIDCTNPAILAYRDVETNGNANINCHSGTITLWFSSDWNSGAAIGDQGRLIEMGAQTTSNGWWSLYFNADNTQIIFGTQTNGLAMTNLTASINWGSNFWHQVALSYSPSNSSLYVDGQPVVTNGLGVFYLPNQPERVNGFCLGSDYNGNNQARGVFDELQTFNYPLSADAIAASYQSAMSTDSDGNGLSDIWEINNFGHLGVVPNADSNGNGLTNLQDYQLGISPVVDQSTMTGSRFNYSYTLADWLNQVSGAKNGTVSMDSEGNVISVSQ